MLNMFSLTIMAVGVGFLGALTGLGGASILVPILVLLGIPVKEAIAAGMVAIIATSSGSAATFVRVISEISPAPTKLLRSERTGRRASTFRRP